MFSFITLAPLSQRIRPPPQLLPHLERQRSNSDKCKHRCPLGEFFSVTSPGFNCSPQLFHCRHCEPEMQESVATQCHQPSLFFSKQADFLLEFPLCSHPTVVWEFNYLPVNILTWSCNGHVMPGKKSWKKFRFSVMWSWAQVWRQMGTYTEKKNFFLYIAFSASLITVFAFL